ncbi:MAG: DNRLRE domain-containing protein, partial [Euryarchaeota archaeon]
MSSSGTNPRKIAISIALVMMFIFADLALPEAIPIMKTTSSLSVFKDTMIDSANPNTNYGSESEVGFGSNTSTDSRILIEFNNTVPSGDVVLSATLEITCGIDPNDVSGITIYPTRMKQTWDESNATWDSRDSSNIWNEPGAEGLIDRDIWSVPSYEYGNQTFSINVTEIAQDAVINSRSTMNMLVTALGPIYDCNMSEATSDQPSLEIVHQTGTHTSGGVLSPSFVADGTPLMDESQFALTADLTPEVTWDNLSGNDVQVQFSKYENFKGQEDAWYFNSEDNSTLFTIGSTDGSMVVPSTNAFSNGSTMYYRMRAIDSSGTIGDWETGNFHLPQHNVSVSNGLATIDLNYTSLMINENTLEDSYI